MGTQRDRYTLGGLFPRTTYASSRRHNNLKVNAIQGGTGGHNNLKVNGIQAPSRKARVVRLKSLNDVYETTMLPIWEQRPGTPAGSPAPGAYRLAAPDIGKLYSING
jgi:hypothetical protein